MDYFIVNRASKSASAAIKTGMQPFAALLNISRLASFAAYHFPSESLNVENLLGKFAKDNIKLTVVGK